MNQELIDNLKQNFLGRAVTVLTQPVGYQFTDPLLHAQYFSGQVADINQYGIWLKHLQSGTYAFHFFPIISIIEEQQLSKDDPRFEKIKEELKKKETQQKSPVVKNIPSQNFIPIEALTKMVKNTKAT